MYACATTECVLVGGAACSSTGITYSYVPRIRNTEKHIPTYGGMCFSYSKTTLADLGTASDIR